MALQEVVVWRISIEGEITVQASDGDNALKEAKKVFKQMDEHVNWTLTQTRVFVEVPEPPPP